MGQNGGGLRGFFRQQNWFLSAGLVMFIYILLVVYVGSFGDGGFFRVGILIHVLPLMALALFALGMKEKRGRDEEEEERKRKRREAKFTLLRQQQEREGQKSPGAGSGEGRKGT